MAQAPSAGPTQHGLLGQFADGFIDTVMRDWSMKGSSVSRHVDFGEHPPSWKPGRLLGMGNGTVTEVECLGTYLAKKTYNVKAMGAERERDVIELRTEIHVLKKLRHKHIIELAGSYTHGIPQQLEVLFWPVAVCSLKEFLADTPFILQHCKGKFDIPVTGVPQFKERVSRLLQITNIELTDTERLDNVLREAGRRIAASFGCLVEAVSYMHGQNVRHKDIKPANILIFPSKNQYSIATDDRQGGENVILDGIRLTDFDGSKTWGHEDNSKTTDTFGTEGYRPPEQVSGRAGDIYSLGNIYKRMGELLSRMPGEHVGADLWALIDEMRSDDPDTRPDASQLHLRLALIDSSARAANYHTSPLFGRCCQPTKRYPTKHTNFLNPMLASPGPLAIIRRNAAGQRIDIAAGEVVPRFDRKKFNEVENHHPCNSYYLLGSCSARCNRSHDMPTTDENISILRALRRRFCCSQGQGCTLPFCIFGHHCTQTKETCQLANGTPIQSCIHGGPPPMGQCRFPDYVHNIDTKVATSTVYYNPTKNFGSGGKAWPHSPSPVAWYPAASKRAIYEVPGCVIH
ncbi:hypothetical protein CEP53_007097 [Fusarium sp. AF-6]|nr:hypothetical protein CEP53_007097 [Fusarium sp. AF-6]